MAFNHGKPYHGSERVEGGKLRGKTGGTDYFFFLCPQCVDDQVLRILDYDFTEPPAPVNRQEKKSPAKYFILAFHLYCPNCQFEDFVKVDNSHRAEPLSPK